MIEHFNYVFNQILQHIIYAHTASGKLKKTKCLKRCSSPNILAMTLTVARSYKECLFQQIYQETDLNERRFMIYVRLLAAWKNSVHDDQVSQCVQPMSNKCPLFLIHRALLIRKFSQAVAHLLFAILSMLIKLKLGDRGKTT